MVTPRERNESGSPDDKVEEALFVPWVISPEPAPNVDWEQAESVKSVDLHKLSPGSIINFFGLHPISRYTCLLEEVEGKPRIRVWLDPEYGSIVGPVDNIVSIHGSKRRTGVMDTSGSYMMAYFIYSEGQTKIDYSQTRIEPYTKILIQRLPSLAH